MQKFLKDVYNGIITTSKIRSHKMYGMPKMPEIYNPMQSMSYIKQFKDTPKKIFNEVRGIFTNYTNIKSHHAPEPKNTIQKNNENSHGSSQGGSQEIQAPKSHEALATTKERIKKNLKNTHLPTNEDPDDEKEKEKQERWKKWKQYAFRATQWMTNTAIIMFLDREASITDEEIDARVEHMHQTNPDMSIEECVDLVLKQRAQMQVLSILYNIFSARGITSVGEATTLLQQLTTGVQVLDAYTTGSPSCQDDKNGALARCYVKQLNITQTNEVKKLQDATVPIAERSIIINKIIEDLKAAEQKAAKQNTTVQKTPEQKAEEAKAAAAKTALIDSFKEDVSKIYVDPKDLEREKNTMHIDNCLTLFNNTITNPMNIVTTAYHYGRNFEKQHMQNVVEYIAPRFADGYKDRINDLRNAAKHYNQENQKTQLDIEKCIQNYETDFKNIIANTSHGPHSFIELLHTFRSMEKFNNSLDDIEHDLQHHNIQNNDELQQYHQKFTQQKMSVFDLYTLHATSINNMSKQFTEQAAEEKGVENMQQVNNQTEPNQGHKI